MAPGTIFDKLSKRSKVGNKTIFTIRVKVIIKITRYEVFSSLYCFVVVLLKSQFLIIDNEK